MQLLISFLCVCCSFLVPSIIAKAVHPARVFNESSYPSNHMPIVKGLQQVRQRRLSKALARHLTKQYRTIYCVFLNYSNKRRFLAYRMATDKGSYSRHRSTCWRFMPPWRITVASLRHLTLTVPKSSAATPRKVWTLNPRRKRGTLFELRSKFHVLMAFSFHRMLESGRRNYFSFSVSGVEASETLLEAELHLYILRSEVTMLREVRRTHIAIVDYG